MGILNITPDSFFDGGKYLEPQKALKYSEKLVCDGIDIIDIGAESTRPGAIQVNVHEEQKRLLPALLNIRGKFPALIISIDTWHADTAEKALTGGADIINDVSACQWDADLLNIIAQWKPGYILTHCKGIPETMGIAPFYDDIVEEIKAFFEQKLLMLTNAGLPEDHIILDVGFGFGKTLEHNLTILSRLNEFMIFKRPLIVGLSMKSFLGELLGLQIKDRTVPTAVASVLAWQKGAFWHRVHDAVQVINSLTLASRIN